MTVTHAVRHHGEHVGDEGAIRVSRLVKTFGTVRALDGLDLTVRVGQVHAFLGPNGAGKTTTIRTLLGLYRPDAGSVSVLGLDPRADSERVNRRTAYVPGEVTLWPSFTGAQVLDTLAGLRGARDRGAERLLIERFDLDPTRRMRTYSKGNRQKVALVAALAAPVDLLILDEPTSGLDPLMEQVFADCITEAAAAGRTILLSSHILAEAERLCSHVTIVKDGRTVETGSLERLRHLAASTVTTRCSPEVADLLLSDVARLPLTVTRRPLPGGEVLLECSVSRQDVPATLAALAAHAVDDVTCTPASLEDLFLRHYRVHSP